MRELKVVGLDADGKNIICQSGSPDDRFKLPVDDRLRAAMRGEAPALEQPQLDIEVTDLLSPKEIQARIRAGASVEQVAMASGSDISRIRRFAHPVLLERSRAAELATAAHPLLADGPSVLTLLETISVALVGRGLNPARLSWDAWRNEDGRWTVQLSWQVGHSDNHAHFCFAPGAHGGTVSAMDDPASELIDPDFKPPLRPLAPVARLEFETDAGEARPFVIMEVVSDDQYRGVAFVDGAKRRSGTASVQFEVHEDEAPTGELPLEIRLRSTGARGVAKALKVFPLGDAVQVSPWIAFPEQPTSWALLEQESSAAAQGSGRNLRSVLRAVRDRVLPGA